MDWLMITESALEETGILNPFPTPGSASKKYSPLLICACTETVWMHKINHKGIR
jgi:hypothetical protein